MKRIKWNHVGMCIGLVVCGQLFGIVIGVFVFASAHWVWSKFEKMKK